MRSADSDGKSTCRQAPGGDGTLLAKSLKSLKNPKNPGISAARATRAMPTPEASRFTGQPCRGTTGFLDALGMKPLGTTPLAHGAQIAQYPASRSTLFGTGSPSWNARMIRAINAPCRSQ